MLCRLKILMMATIFFGRYKEKRIFWLRSIDGGVLDDRDAAADLRDRLQRELDARELM
jgi:hypothetical protein